MPEHSPSHERGSQNQRVNDGHCLLFGRVSRVLSEQFGWIPAALTIYRGQRILVLNRKAQVSAGAKLEVDRMTLHSLSPIALSSGH